MSRPNPNRPDMRLDLTRWNRAGLSRFDYVDGDAAVWLEELRIAFLGLYLRGGDDVQRTPEFWRDLYLEPVEDWPDTTSAAARVAWERLAPVFPAQQETRGRRNERLLSQYGERTGDQTWEIARAFARASHVLLGHLNAYAGEGYLRTATQWENLRRLAEMVNYQPAPPASATTTVALGLKDGAGAVEIPRGLAMKHTPPEGGAPLIFETLAPLEAHEALNAARSVDWNVNSTPMKLGGTDPLSAKWHLDAGETLAPGDLVLLSGSGGAEAFAIKDVIHDIEAETAEIQLSAPPTKTYVHHSARLNVIPADIRTGVQRSSPGFGVLKLAEELAVNMGDMVVLQVNGADTIVEVLEVKGQTLVLDTTLADDAQVSVAAMTAYAVDSVGSVSTDGQIDTLYFYSTSGIEPETGSPRTDISGETFAYDFNVGYARDRRGYRFDTTAPLIKANVSVSAPVALPGSNPQPSQLVTFEGKPPKGLGAGDWFVARDMDDDSLVALQVEAVRTSAGTYHVQFDKKPKGLPQDTEFHGPMRQALPPVVYQRNPENAIVGGQAHLQDLPAEAADLLKPGRTAIFSNVHPDFAGDQRVSLTSVTRGTDGVTSLTFTPPEAGAGWAAGDTVFRLNAAAISHGETKGPKTLGSGDGETSRQAFLLSVKEISHVPSSRTEAGVVPDIDVIVDNVLWDYADLTDPTAEDTPSWSSALTEDGDLRLIFRRRLVTGTNNVVVRRHRVGVGLQGSGVPPFSFDKPMKKDRYVETVVQPFATAGGANREAVDKLRTSAPSRLAANGRAVSLKDFERLARRQSSVLAAHAQLVPGQRADRHVLLTIAPVGGGALSDTLKSDLRPAILNKSLPGIRLSFAEYQTLPLHLGATVRADLAVFDEADVKAAAQEALIKTFALEARTFGQTAYVSEVLAALETVEGIETAIVTRFDLGPDYDLLNPKPPGFTEPWPKNVATRDGAVAAIYPEETQIAHLGSESAGSSAQRITILVEDA
ncbi:MAG: hypothetical protein AAF667_04680 [Pseudomonadota bacterium]